MTKIGVFRLTRNGDYRLTLTMDRHECWEEVKENIGYGQLRERYDREVIDEILTLITDALCSTRTTLRIGGGKSPSRR